MKAVLFQVSRFGLFRYYILGLPQFYVSFIAYALSNVNRSLRDSPKTVRRQAEPASVCTRIKLISVFNTDVCGRFAESRTKFMRCTIISRLYFQIFTVSSNARETQRNKVSLAHARCTKRRHFVNFCLLQARATPAARISNRKSAAGAIKRAIRGRASHQYGSSPVWQITAARRAMGSPEYNRAPPPGCCLNIG